MLQTTKTDNYFEFLDNFTKDPLLTIIFKKMAKKSVKCRSRGHGLMENKKICF
jgi:hypothetical protein